MRSSLAFALVASLLLVPAAGCGSETANPINTGGSSSSSGTPSSSSTGTAGSGGTGGSAPTNSCSPACGSGEVCVESACHALVTLASAGASNCTMVLDATDVYVATQQLQVVPKAGGNTIDEAIWVGGSGLAVDSTYLYFNGNTGISRAAKTGPFHAEPFAGEGVLPAAAHIASDGTAIYYLAASTDQNPPAVYETPTTGTPDPTAPPTVFATNIYGIGTVAVDATSVYYCGSSAGLVKEDKTTQAITPLASTCPDAIVADGADVYYATAPTEGAGAIVARVSGAGGASTVLADTTLGVNGVFAIDADSVYFMTFSSVMKVSKTGGAPVTVSALGLPTPFPTCMAADDTYVYWVDGTSLMRFTK
jgi:hypothetical protein